MKGLLNPQKKVRFKPENPVQIFVKRFKRRRGEKRSNNEGNIEPQEPGGTRMECQPGLYSQESG